MTILKSRLSKRKRNKQLSTVEVEEKPETASNLTKLPYLAALRPKQWTKNLIVFAAPLFAFNFSLDSLFGSVLAFALFCCASSSFYLLNDVVDVEDDRLHPVKCKRPIAAGLVSIPVAIGMAICLLAGALIVAWLRAPLLAAIILGYAVLQVAYNIRLKHAAILDVISIATGFVLRACAGAVATGVTLSPWFMLCVAMLALFLGVEKRKAELKQLEAKGGYTKRRVLYRYSLDLLGRMENTVVTGTISFYALWSAGPIVHGASTPWMMLALPLVLYGVFRYQLLSDPQEIARRSALGIKGQQTERPEEVLLKDLPMLLTVITWVALTFVILLLKKQGILS